MPGAQADEVLVGAPAPVDRQAQRVSLRLERESNPVVRRDPHLEPRAPPTVALERQRHAFLRARGNPRGQRALDRRQLLPGHHALGELDEVVVHRAVGHPGAQRPDDAALCAANVQLKRPQGDLDLQRTALQHDHICAACTRQ